MEKEGAKRTRGADDKKARRKSMWCLSPKFLAMPLTTANDSLAYTKHSISKLYSSLAVCKVLAVVMHSRCLVLLLPGPVLQHIRILSLSTRSPLDIMNWCC